MLRLGVNVDHVATLRQARYRGLHKAKFAEPDPLAFALAAQKVGAHGITAHLREDRRHMQESDILALRRKVEIPLNLEMAATPEMVAFAKKIRPPHVCLVPEKREELTTEGGLDVISDLQRISQITAELQKIRARVSLFIDPDPKQVESAAIAGADVVELHTGTYAHAKTKSQRTHEIRRLIEAAFKAHQLGLEVHAGHGLNYENLLGILIVPGLNEVNIGHSIISRALSVGAERAVRDMLHIVKKYRLSSRS